MCWNCNANAVTPSEQTGKRKRSIPVERLSPSKKPRVDLPSPPPTTQRRRRNRLHTEASVQRNASNEDASDRHSGFTFRAPAAWTIPATPASLPRVQNTISRSGFKARRAESNVNVPQTSSYHNAPTSFDQIPNFDCDMLQSIDEDMEMEEVDEDAFIGAAVDEDELESVDEDELESVDEDELESVDEDELESVYEDELQNVDPNSDVLGVRQESNIRGHRTSNIADKPTSGIDEDVVEPIMERIDKTDVLGAEVVGDDALGTEVDEDEMLGSAANEDDLWGSAVDEDELLDDDLPLAAAADYGSTSDIDSDDMEEVDEDGELIGATVGRALLRRGYDSALDVDVDELNSVDSETDENMPHDYYGSGEDDFKSDADEIDEDDALGSEVDEDELFGSAVDSEGGGEDGELVGATVGRALLRRSYDSALDVDEDEPARKYLLSQIGLSLDTKIFAKQDIHGQASTSIWQISSF
ncbi:hypothetical protein BDZ89DRAFT_1047068 [Hymenopellis radicata]|nr:hypothetical protein BDZ89DRAFT_1047068 [Hymenopellis radicata]